MTAGKPLSFSQALAEVKKADSDDSHNRFVETGDGLEVEKDAAATADTKPAGTKPKLVPIEDILLDILEDEDGVGAADDDEDDADES